MTALVASTLQAKTNPAGTTISATLTGAGHATDTYPWTIQKAAEPATQDVASGSNGTVTWTITVSKGAANSTAYFDGQICVTNTGGQPTQNLAIQAQLSKPPSNTILATSAVDVSAHPVLGAGETQCYPFQIAVPSGSIAPGATYKVTAQVTITNRSGKVGTPTGVSAKASIKLPSPNVVNGTITVSDTNGQTFNFSASGSQSYQQVIQCSTAHDDSQTLNNTATITATGQTAPATASVTCTARTINGTAAFHYFTEASTSSTASSPIDLSVSTVEALVPDGQGGLVSYSGSGGVGTFTIPNVPPGQYMLHVDHTFPIRTTYVVTDANAVDLGSRTNGRPDAAGVTQSSIVNMNVGNLDSWQSGDFLEFYAPGAGDWDFGTERFDNGGNFPNDGDTSVNLSVDLGALIDPRSYHIDATAGDHAYLAQLSQQTTLSGIPYFVLTRFFPLRSFSSIDGGSVTAADFPTNAADVFSVVSRSHSVNVDFRASQFMASLTADGNPNQTFILELFDVASVPGTNIYAFNSFSADQLLVEHEPDGNDFTTGVMSYGDLPSGNWGQFVDVRYESRVSYGLPNSLPAHLVNGLFSTTSIATGTAGPTVPQLSPPRNIKINGSDFFSDQTGIGAFPTISWSAPAIGTPNYYSLTIYQLTLASNRTDVQAIAALYTPNTSITLPGLLIGSQKYVVVLEAIGSTAGPALDITKPYQGQLNMASARVSSGVFTP